MTTDLNHRTHIAFLGAFPPYRGGIPRFNDYVLKHLMAHSDVQVDAYNFKQLYPDLLFPGTSQFAEHPEPPYAEAMLHSYRPGSWRETGRNIASQHPDMLLFAYWHPFFAPAFTSVLKTVKKICPSVHIAGIFHNAFPHDAFPGQTGLLKRLLRYTDIPIALSPGVETELNGIPESGKQVVRLYHPVYDAEPSIRPAFSIRRQYQIGDHEKVILFYGAVRPYKGVDVLIEAVNRLQPERYPFRVILAGEFYQNETRLTRNFAPAWRNRYRIMNRFLTDAETADLFKIADVCVLPYKRASQSGVLMDAVNFGTPVIASRLAGLEEIVEHRKNGLLFEPGNPEALARRLMETEKNDLLTALRAGQNEAKNRFSWKTFSEKLLHVFRTHDSHSGINPARNRKTGAISAPVYRDFAVVIPAYNEAGNAEDLVTEMRTAFKRHRLDGEVILVDDGSDDGTAEQFRKAANGWGCLRILRHRCNLGKTEAIITAAKATDKRWLVLFDADLQHSPDEIPRFLHQLEQGYDIVTGRKVGRYRKHTVSKIYNWLNRAIFGVPVTDMNSMKAFRRDVLSKVQLRHNWHRFFVVLAWMRGFTITEIDIRLYPRRHGTSKYSHWRRIPAGLQDLMTVAFSLFLPRRIAGKGYSLTTVFSEKGV